MPENTLPGFKMRPRYRHIDGSRIGGNHYVKPRN